VRLRKRQTLGYLACALLFTAGVLLSIRLSFPPDPSLRHLHRAPRPQVDVAADDGGITVRAHGAQRRYKLYGTARGIVARELEPGERDEPEAGEGG
jgi:hypothetical protein